MEEPTGASTAAAAAAAAAPSYVPDAAAAASAPSYAPAAATAYAAAATAAAAAGVTSAAGPAAAAAGVTPATAPTAAGTTSFAATEAHKRKYAEIAFRSSKYYTMRTIAKDLRSFVVEVLRVPDLRSNKAAQEILTKMKFMIELLKEMRVETAFSREFKKFKEDPGLAGASKDVPMTKPQCGETPAPVPAPAPAQPQPGVIHVPPFNPAVPVTQPEKQQSKRVKQAATGRNPGSGRTAEEIITLVKESGKQADGEIPLSYVVGGSPIGWNFLLFPGGRAVYYGVTKAAARLRRAAK